MPKALRVRFWIIVASLAAGALCLVPTLAGEMPPWWNKLVPVQKLRLGLDLKGGVHLVLGVQVDKAVENATERIANELRDTLRRKRLGVGTVRREGLTTVVLVPSADAPLDKVREEIAEYPTFQIDKDGAGEIRMQMRASEADRIRTYSVDQGLETIRNRIDQFGVAETTVVKQGTNRILVELPGVSDQARARQLIGKTALLEFKLIDETNSLEEALKGNEVSVLVVTDVHAEGALGEVDASYVVGDELGPESLRLPAEVAHHRRADDAVGVAGVVLDVRGDHQLAAPVEALDQERVQIGARRVERSRIPGRAAADDDHVTNFVHSCSLSCPALCAPSP